MPTTPSDAPPRLGWCLVTFLNEALEPATDGRITATELFVHYRRWCARNRLVPICEGEFINLLGKIAPEVEMPIKQSGGNISLINSRLSA